MKPLLSDKQYSIETAISSGPYKRPTGVLAASARIARQVLLSVADALFGRCLGARVSSRIVR